jgi:hypothetical protein
MAILKALTTLTPVTPHRIVPELPRMFSGLVMRLLARDPDDRPQSAREVVEAIAALERGEPEPELEEEVETSPPEETVSPATPAEEKGERKRDARRPRHAPVRRRKKRPEAGGGWGLWVLIAGAVLLVVVVLVLVLVLILRAG